MKTIDMLKSEHAAILQVLDDLELAAGAIEHHVPITGNVVHDIADFLMVFMELNHQIKEEREIVTRLRSFGKMQFVNNLEADHTTLRRLTELFIDAIRTNHLENQDTAGELAAIIRVYSGFLRRHIAFEQQELFPAIEWYLKDKDQEIMDACRYLEEQRVGPEANERLHTIVDQFTVQIHPWATAKV